MLADVLGSVAALAAGIVIQTTGWTPIDSVLSLLICALIGVPTYRLAGEAIHTLLEGVPPELSLPAVGKRMAALPDVASIHDLHIWTIASGHVALSAHVVVRDFSGWDALLQRLRSLLRDEFAIDHVTLQPEVQAPASSPIAPPRSLRDTHP